jgi:pimeloyl-ACP methyl ester carboxylesterase
MSLNGVKRGGPNGRPRRPKGVLAIGWACIESAASGRTEHRPTSADYPPDVIDRISFTAGGGFPWRISALITPRVRPAEWKIVVITGAPSWAEYWAPVMAALPGDREMVVVDRPGYGASEPEGCVPSIRDQAAALEPLLDGPRGQKIVLVGQSYGAAIATLMAAARPGRLASVVLLSSYLGESGPTARWLVDAGSRLKGVIPRDLRHAVIEVSGQPPQMPLMHEALARLDIPIHVIHGDADDFAPIELARRLAAETKTRRPITFQSVAEANHFLNDQPVETVIACLEACLPRPRSSPRRLIGRLASGLAGRLGGLARPAQPAGV